jgi:hypothetical protein
VLLMESGFACKMSKRMTAFHQAEDRNLEVRNRGLCFVIIGPTIDQFFLCCWDYRVRHGDLDMEVFQGLLMRMKRRMGCQ